MMDAMLPAVGSDDPQDWIFRAEETTNSSPQNKQKFISTWNKQAL